MSDIPEGYALINLKDLEADMVSQMKLMGGRFPSVETIDKFQKLKCFVDLTRKYIVLSDKQQSI